MKHPIVAVLLAGGMLGLAGPASAQFFPSYGYGGWGGYDGAAALLGSDQRQVTAMQLKAQNMQAGQQAAMQQNYVVQSGIRNTLSNQAQSQTNAILSKQQANQDWWFQQQSQQMAQRRAAEYASGAPAVPVGFAPSGGPPPASMDIIKWPTVLQESCFASERAKIEAPYRRTPPKLSAPTPADYTQMASTVEDMKAVLEWRLKDGVNTADYNAAKVFLNQLGQEVTARAKRPTFQIEFGLHRVRGWKRCPGSLWRRMGSFHPGKARIPNTTQFCLEHDSDKSAVLGVLRDFSFMEPLTCNV